MTPTSKKHFNTLRSGIPQYDPANILSKQELSTLIHKIGHEIGNPLTAIISLASIIERFAADINTNADFAGKISSYSSSIINESWRINQHSEKLVMLLSQKIGNLYLLNITDVINQAHKKFQLRNKNKNLAIHTIANTQDTPHAFVDNDQFVILLSELFFNACSYQAYENQSEETEINIEIESDDKFSKIFIYNKIKEALPFELEKLFEPYITKYADKKHLGIGLTMCLNIVKKFKGNITISEMEKNKELFFCIELSLPNKEYVNS